MSSTISLKTVLATCSILSLAPQVLAHMEMSWPYPLRSKYDPTNSYTIIDYSMTSPLVMDGSNFPCKGYQNDRPIVNKATYQAGQTYNMTLAGSATHGGGSCQLSLSYDNGATFRVIQSMIGGCPLTSTYDFTIPSYAPDGNALFAWSWQNLQGNREFYMNCAEVDIAGSTASKRDDTSFDDLPFIWKANLEGLNDCATTENVIPVYPEPGPVVIYGSGATSSSAATSDPGVCDAAKPFGQTYEYLGDTVNPTTEVLGSAAASTIASSSVTSSTPTTTLVTSSKPTTTSSSSTPAVSHSTSSLASSSSVLSTLTTSTKPATSSSSSSVLTSSSVASSKTSLTVQSSHVASSSTPSSSSSSSSSSSTIVTYSSVGAGRAGTTHSAETCPPDVTITVYADASTTTTKKASSSVSPSTTVSPSLTGSTVSTLLGFSTASSSTVLVVSAASSSAKSSKATSSATSSAAGPEVTEESYATGDLATYLPCVPGTFICTTNTTWVTCDQTMYSNGQTAWVYEESRSVSDGMACLPNLSPYSSSTSQYAQQADAPSGYYRDDRIARSQPYGSCSVDGSLSCDGPSQFFICDQGGLVLMGAVAAGTTCTNDKIVATS